MYIAAPLPETWLRPTREGLYCEPGGFHIDPVVPVPRAVVTHGHSDHARPGNAAVLATPETIAIMRHRYGAEAGGSLQAFGYGEALSLGEVRVRFAPAGHVLGSAQAVIDYRGSRVVVSGDYKRRSDPTCARVSNTVRGGVEYNYRMVIAEDGVAEVNKQAHAGELATMQRLFADVMAVEEIVARLRSAGS